MAVFLRPEYYRGNMDICFSFGEMMEGDFTLKSHWSLLFLTTCVQRDKGWKFWGEPTACLRALSYISPPEGVPLSPRLDIPLQSSICQDHIM